VTVVLLSFFYGIISSSSSSSFSLPSFEETVASSPSFPFLTIVTSCLFLGSLLAVQHLPVQLLHVTPSSVALFSSVPALQSCHREPKNAPAISAFQQSPLQPR
jgi:hypothetical protein